MSPTRRERASRWLFVGAFVLFLVAAGPQYVQTVIDDEDAFVHVADEVLVHPDVREVVATTSAILAIEVITGKDAVVDVLPGATRAVAVPITKLATDQLVQLAFAAIDSDVAVQARHVALRDLHRQITADPDEIVVDLGTLVVRTTRAVAGQVVGAGAAALVAQQGIGEYTVAVRGGSGDVVFTALDVVSAVGLWCVGFGVLALIAAMALTRRISNALTRAGMVLAGAAIVATFLWAALVGVAVTAALGTGPVAGAIGDVVAADLARHQHGPVLAGAVLMAVGLFLSDRPALQALRRVPRDLWHRRPNALAPIGTALAENPPASSLVGWALTAFAVISWSTPSWRVLLTILIVGAAYQAIVWASSSDSRGAERVRGWLDLASPDDASASAWAHHRALRVNVGAVLLVVLALWPVWDRNVTRWFVIIGALIQVVLLIAPARRARTVSDEEVAPADVEPARGSRRRLVIAAGAAVVALVGAVAVTSASTGQTADSEACNGDVSLCDRRIDEVVFAGSHNAMSSSDLGWDLALQEGDMVTQLDLGVRALLIDALYWNQEGRIDGEASAATEAALDAAAEEDTAPRPGTWLCHGFCALGATDLTAGLSEIDVWLTEHPREVLIIIVQDEIRFADLEAAFVASGLRDRAWVHRTGDPFPTLREMIDAGQQLLVYGENQGEPDTWFQNGYADTFSETPYSFQVASDFNCEPNRGGDDNPLFLINHWLTTGLPVREAAALVNSRRALLDRVADCEETRGRRPTILAVDFVQIGDLFTVVDELNDVD